MAGEDGRAGSRAERDAPAFGHRDRSEEPSPLTGRQKLIALVAILAVVATITGFAVLEQPDPSVRPNLLGGTTLLPSQNSEPVVVDLTDGAVSARFDGLKAKLNGVARMQTLRMRDGWLVLDRQGGTYNFLNGGGLLTGRDPGVFPGFKLAEGVASEDTDQAFMLLSKVADSFRDPALAPVDALHLGAGSRTVLQLNGDVADRPGQAISVKDSVYVVLHDGSGNAVIRYVLDAKHALVRTKELVRGLPSPVALEVSRAGDGSANGIVVASGRKLARFSLEGDEQATGATPEAASIVPLGNSESNSWLLEHSSSGSSLVAIGAGTPAVRSLPVQGAAIDMTMPSQISDGKVYALSAPEAAGRRRVFVIDARTGAADVLRVGGEVFSYPGAGNVPDFATAEARAHRVVFNLLRSRYAMVVFTDRDGMATLVDKETTKGVASLNPDGVGPNSSTRKTPVTKSTGVTKPLRHPTPVTNKTIVKGTCEQLDQKPHKPRITGIDRAPHQLAVKWVYERFDATECIPQAWQVEIQGLNGAHVPHSGPIDVADTKGNPVNVTQWIVPQLHVRSAYQMRVRARTRKEDGDWSDWRPATTLDNGPDAALEVQSKPNGSTAWIVGWKAPCALADCDPAPVAWEVRASQACDRREVPNVRLTVPVSAAGADGRFSVPVNFIDTRWGDLLARSIGFTVTPVSDHTTSGGQGDSNARPTACTKAVRPPLPRPETWLRVTLTKQPTNTAGDFKVDAYAEIDAKKLPGTAPATDRDLAIYAFGTDAAVTAQFVVLRYTNGNPTGSPVTQPSRAVGLSGRSWSLPGIGPIPGGGSAYTYGVKVTLSVGVASFTVTSAAHDVSNIASWPTVTNDSPSGVVATHEAANPNTGGFSFKVLGIAKDSVSGGISRDLTLRIDSPVSITCAGVPVDLAATVEHDAASADATVSLSGLDLARFSGCNGDGSNTVTLHDATGKIHGAAPKSVNIPAVSIVAPDGAPTVTATLAPFPSSSSPTGFRFDVKDPSYGTIMRVLDDGTPGVLLTDFQWKRATGGTWASLDCLPPPAAPTGEGLIDLGSSCLDQALAAAASDPSIKKILTQVHYAANVRYAGTAHVAEGSATVPDTQPIPVTTSTTSTTSCVPVGSGSSTTASTTTTTTPCGGGGGTGAHHDAPVTPLTMAAAASIGLAWHRRRRAGTLAGARQSPLTTKGNS